MLSMGITTAGGWRLAVDGLNSHLNAVCTGASINESRFLHMQAQIGVNLLAIETHAHTFASPSQY